MSLDEETDMPVLPGTRARVQALFRREDHGRVIALLEARCGSTLPAIDPPQSELVMRIRWAVLRASHGEMDRLEQQVERARIDWRDVLVEAEFADDPKAHLRWDPQSSR